MATWDPRKAPWEYPGYPWPEPEIPPRSERFRIRGRPEVSVIGRPYVACPRRRREWRLRPFWRLG